MFQIDPRFRQMGQRAQKTRRRATGLRAAGVAAVIAALAVAGWQVWQPDLGRLFGDDLDQQLTQVDEGFDIARPVAVDTFTDIPGDPLIIPLPDQDAAPALRLVPTPAALTLASGHAPPGAQLAVMRDNLIRQDHTLMPRLPATREEFALFQAERSRGHRAAGTDPAPAALVIPQDQRAVSGLAFLRPPAERPLLWEETLIEVAVPASITDLLARHGFDAAEGEAIHSRMAATTALPDQLPAGSLLALRFRRNGAARQIIQLSLYGPDGYVGSLALSGAGQLVAAADPWADQALTSRVSPTGPGGQQRLLDVIYSAALRDNVPPEVIGAALAMMAEQHDLDAFADPGDRLTLVWSMTDGRIMFIGTDGPSGARPCYVVAGDGGLRCFVPGAQGPTAAGAPRLLVPVSGILTQRFAPGDGAPSRGIVMWSAPEGSPVIAAASGRVTRATVDPVLGAEAEITHPDGSISRYRGMRSLAPGIAANAAIAAGAPVGETGTAPGMDEPGLIFQLIEGGVPVNPMPSMTGTVEIIGSDAVEALIAQIIQVESAGNPPRPQPAVHRHGSGPVHRKHMAADDAQPPPRSGRQPVAPRTAGPAFRR